MLTVFLSASYLCFNQYIVVLHPLCQELLYRLGLQDDVSGF